MIAPSIVLPTFAIADPKFVNADFNEPRASARDWNIVVFFCICSSSLVSLKNTLIASLALPALFSIATK